MLRPTATLADRGARRLAAGTALFYVGTFVVALLLTGPPVVHEGQEGIEHSLSERGPLPVLAAMFVLTLGLLGLTVAMTFLAQATGRGSAAGALLAQTAWGAGLAYVVVLTVAFCAGAAGAWALHSGADLSTVLSVNNIRNFAYFAVMPFMGVYALLLGVAALGDRLLTGAVGWGGVVVGVACLLGVPAAAAGLSYAMPLWLVWWLTVAIALLRHRPTSSTTSTAPSRYGSSSGTLEPR